MSEKGKKDVIIVKKRKKPKGGKSGGKKKLKKKKTTKTTRERGITININVGKSTGKEKAPKGARGFAPKATSLRGQRVRSNLDYNKAREAVINENLMNNVYAVRDRATRQGEDIRDLNTSFNILESKVNLLGTQVLRAGAPRAIEPAPAPAPAQSERDQKFITDVKRGMIQLGQRQQSLYEGMRLMTDAQHNIHHRLQGIEEAGRQIAGNQGTALALNDIWDDGETPVNIEQPPAPPPSPPPPPPVMETEEDPSRVSSSVDVDQEERRGGLLIEDAQPTLNKTQMRFNKKEVDILKGIAFDTVTKNRKERSKFYDESDDFKNILKKGYGRASTINRINEERNKLKKTDKKLSKNIIIL